MAVYEGAEEILVGSCYHSAVVTRIFNCDRWWILNRTVYLYIVLMKFLFITAEAGIWCFPQI